MGKQWKKAGKIANAQTKGAQFTKIIKEITIASRLGGPDPNSNSRLRLAMETAKRASCPKDTMERAIKKGAGLLGDENIIEEITYEGYAPHGVGVIVECQSDNRNRTASEIRFLFKNHGGNLGENGSVLWMFDRVSLIEGKKKQPPNDPEEEAIEVNANNVEVSEDHIFTFYGSPEDLDSIRTSLINRGWEIITSELSYKAKETTQLKPEQHLEVVSFLESLDENEDTSRIHSTID